MTSITEQFSFKEPVEALVEFVRLYIQVVDLVENMTVITYIFHLKSILLNWHVFVSISLSFTSYWTKGRTFTVRVARCGRIRGCREVKRGEWKWTEDSLLKKMSCTNIKNWLYDYHLWDLNAICLVILSLFVFGWWWRGREKAGAHFFASDVHVIWHRQI